MRSGHPPSKRRPPTTDLAARTARDAPARGADRRGAWDQRRGRSRASCGATPNVVGGSCWARRALARPRTRRGVASLECMSVAARSLFAFDDSFVRELEGLYVPWEGAAV